jgi:hypothetical protein
MPFTALSAKGKRLDWIAGLAGNGRIAALPAALSATADRFRFHHNSPRVAGIDAATLGQQGRICGTSCQLSVTTRSERMGAQGLEGMIMSSPRLSLKWM